jgi:hypothetical protein
MPGVLSFEFRRPAESHQLFIGPFDDVAPGEDTFSTLQTESEICAPCHFGLFWDTPIYNSFGEWLVSPYANAESGQMRTCQDCHMPQTGVERFARPDKDGLRRDPATIFGHKMTGAGDEDLLQNSAELALATERPGDGIRVTATVTNSGAGHHLPTDSPLRQIFLIVAATDEEGRVLSLQSGPTLPDWAGDLAGEPGVYFAKILEQRWTGIVPGTAYWMPTRIVEDTRLPALASTTATFEFAAPEDGPVTIEAQLLFRRAFFELMQQKGWDTPDIVMETATAHAPTPNKTP